MSKARWIIFAVVCALVLGGLVLLASRNKQDVSDINANSIIKDEDGVIGDNVYGPKDAKVVLYEYGDFQCPSCGGAYPQLKKIKEKYKDQIAFVFRNLPLTTIHPNALSAAAAAEAAGQQGKFWEMHDELYENQNDWSSASIENRNGIFEGYARNIGLNIDKYKSDLSGKAVTDKIARDRGLAKKLNLSSTPSLLIGDEQLSSDIVSNTVSSDGAKLEAEIARKLKAAGVELPKAE